jgi:hypothetical protein
MSDEKPVAFINPNMADEELQRRFKEFMEEDEYASKHFWRHFGERKARMAMPVPSVLDAINAGVCYDAENQFDLRMILMTFIHDHDKQLFIDVAKFVAEKYVNNPSKPAGPLTLMQFKADLARRLVQVGF